MVDLASGFDETNLRIMEDADLTLLVVEPTAKDLRALQQNAALLREQGIRASLCINRADLNKEYTMRILDEARSTGLKNVGKLSHMDELNLMLETARHEGEPFFGLIPNALKAELAKMMVSIQFLTKEEGE